MLHRFPAIIERAEEGRYVISVPDVSFCHEEGRTPSEALVSGKAALIAGLEFMIYDRKPSRPQDSRFCASSLRA